MPKPNLKSSGHLTVGKLAEHINLSQKTIRRAIDAGDIRVHRFGRLVRIAIEDAQTFIAARRS